MNIAIIGCGNIAQTHAAELHGLGHQIVAAINATMGGQLCRERHCPGAGRRYRRRTHLHAADAA